MWGSIKIFNVLPLRKRHVKAKKQILNRDDDSYSNTNRYDYVKELSVKIMATLRTLQYFKEI